MTNSGLAYTVADDNYLRKNASTPIKLQAHELGRTIAAIEKRREKLGIYKSQSKAPATNTNAAWERKRLNLRPRHQVDTRSYASICFDCQKAYANPKQGCSKFTKGTLPPGCVIEEKGEYGNQIVKCPLYMRDERRRDYAGCLGADPYT